MQVIKRKWLVLECPFFPQEFLLGPILASYCAVWRRDGSKPSRGRGYGSLSGAEAAGQKWTAPEQKSGTDTPWQRVVFIFVSTNFMELLRISTHSILWTIIFLGMILVGNGRGAFLGKGTHERLR